jgi:hypothetical protein
MVWISQLSPDISPRTGASLTSSPDSLFLLCGANHEQGPLSDLYTYSLSSFKWSTSHIPIPPRYDHACSKMSDNLIVFGGCGETGPINDTWIYSIKSQSWREVFNGPCARTIQSMPVISNKAFIFGGGVSGFNAIDDTSIWIFDLINGWSSISTPGPCARQGHSLVAIGASIYMFGGMNGSVSFDDVWKFDTSSNEWSKVATSGEGPMARSGHVACLIDETRIAVYGGLVRDPKARVIGDVFILDTGMFTFFLLLKNHLSGHRLISKSPLRVKTEVFQDQSLVLIVLRAQYPLILQPVMFQS